MGARRRPLLAVGIVLLAASFVASRWERWLMDALAPDAPFDASAAPTAPDYADAATWTAHPARSDPSDVAPDGLRAIDAASAPADAFYVHPTSYLGSQWNGPIDDPALNAQTEAGGTLIQASAFNGCCAVYGPLYRQANGDAFLRPGPDGDAAIELAYGDVRAAFHFYLEHHGRGRPFVLAAHSQGSVLAARLLEEEIAGTALMDRLVAAYLPGAPIPDASLAGVPACAAPDDTGCLAAWNARGPRFAGSAFDFPVAHRRLCVNPLTWRHDEAAAGRDQNEGAVFLDAGGGAPLAAFASAQCRGGMLLVAEIGRAPRDFMSRVLDFVMGPENHHPIEYQLYYMSLRRNAQTRVDAYLRRHGMASLQPAR